MRGRGNEPWGGLIAGDPCFHPGVALGVQKGDALIYTPLPPSLLLCLTDLLSLSLCVGGWWGGDAVAHVPGHLPLAAGRLPALRVPPIPTTPRHQVNQLHISYTLKALSLYK